MRRVRPLHGTLRRIWPLAFCPFCGAEQPREPELPWTGDCPDKGIYRISFEPVFGEFSDSDAAGKAARHSAWGEDRSFDGVTVEKMRSTVGPETHPFVCANPNCYDGYVSETDQGRCRSCGGTEWKRR